MPLVPLKVSADKFEPYARYRTVSFLAASSFRRTSSTSCAVSNGVSLSDSDRRCFVGEQREDEVLAWSIIIPELVDRGKRTFHRWNLDALQPLCSRDPAPPLLTPGSASAQVCSRTAAQDPSRSIFYSNEEPESASPTIVQFTTSASQNSSPDSYPRLPVHAGTLSAF